MEPFLTFLNLVMMGGERPLEAAPAASLLLKQVKGVRLFLLLLQRPFFKGRALRRREVSRNKIQIKFETEQ